MAGRCPRSNGGSVTDATVPKPGDPTYRDAVSAFYSSVIAVQVNDANNRTAFTEQATKLAPGEPAAWANQALSYLRSQNSVEADKSLKRAEALAPDDPQVLVLRGLITESLGKFEEAGKIYQKASEKDAEGVEALYYLAQSADKARGADEWTIKKRAYEEILRRRPGNFAALVLLLETLAGAQDKEGFQKRFPELVARTAVWSAEQRTILDAFVKELPGLDGRTLRRGYFGVKGQAQRTIDWQLGLRDLGKATFLLGSPPGNPMTKPLKLVVPSPAPAAPDTALSYAVEPLGSAPATTTLAVPLDDKSAPTVFVATQTGVLAGDKPLPAPGRATALAAFDVNDEVGAMKLGGDPREFLLDLAVAGPGGLRLLKNGPSGFTDATAASKLPVSVTAAPSTGVWSVDFEADGDLDLIVSQATGGPQVLQNNGNGSFVALSGKLPGVLGPIKDLAWADFDNDGDPDLAVIDSANKLHVLANQRSGLFEPWAGTPAPVGVTALAVAEVNGDTRLDLLVSQSGTVSALCIGDDKKWQIQPLAKSTSAMSGRLIAEDLDNNGGVDLIVAGESASELFLRDSTGKHLQAPTSIPLSVDSVADLNNDGTLDLVGRAGGKAVRALAKPTKKYNYQTFTLKAAFPGKEPGNKINAYAIGGELEARAGLWYRKLPLSGPQVHIGLGENPKLDAARILWPNGNPQGEFDFTKKVLVADQRLGGSCPFLFAWNGKEFAFVTDCIWRSPVGLKINAQATAGVNQTEDWVKIRGDQLAPQGGFYDLRVTAELRETHFFDHLGLMAVDHPVGTDIWIDERFSPAEKPLLKVISTKAAQPLKSATGFDGKDASQTLAKRDKNYLDDFGRGQYQGVTKDHWVEISLPESAPKGAPLYVIAHGWLHPTDSSVNVALSQNPAQSPPQGLSLWTPDSTGKWTLAKPNLGFPEGKLKTVVLRIDTLFKPGAARKVRLRTNLEVYWDQIRWAEGLPDAMAKSTRLTPESADLRYRGFSHVVAKDSSSPELPESYANLAGTAPRWRDLEGCYTRFGSVEPLLSRIDDRYVIMNAGDELALRFKEIAKPTAGLVRDFVLIGDGWVKDGNVNTQWGQTVHPLPSHARTSYPRTNFLEEDPVYKAHEADFLEYHTRRVTTGAFTQAMKP